MSVRPALNTASHKRFLSRLAQDNSGNVLAIVAASLFPLLALVGSAIDMGRGYMVQTRLQQACDSGVLAARKRLGTQAVVNNTIPAEVGQTGQRFFNANFRQGSLSSTDRSFAMIMENDYAITGSASANVPTTVMRAFAFQTIPVNVTCQAQLNMTNTDVMMVLDVTGSMGGTNSGDTVSRIQALRNTVSSFHTQMTTAASPGTRVRFGFVPYSANVNVGNLLDESWLVDSHQYNFRWPVDTGETEQVEDWDETETFVSGTILAEGPNYTSTCPTDTMTERLSNESYRSSREQYRSTKNGTEYDCELVDGDTYVVNSITYTDYVTDVDRQFQGMVNQPIYEWRYGRYEQDLNGLWNPVMPDRGKQAGAVQAMEASNGRTKNSHWLDSLPNLVVGTGDGKLIMDIGGLATNPSQVVVEYQGCIEERATYEITDYDNVDLTRALDLDLNTVPTNDDSTKWRPMLHELSYIRSLDYNGNGSFTSGSDISDEEFANAATMGRSACPAAASKLAEMTSEEVTDYLNSLSPDGNTYHDIGMIWGGRLLSPNGIFAAENADLGNGPTARHLIFLTDGETAPNDLTYGTYGIEPLDQRRWNQSSADNLTEVVENRFSFACDEVTKMNVQVWVISFGTSANSIMEECAGAERYFVADDATELEQTFSDIARQMGELRVTN